MQKINNPLLALLGKDKHIIGYRPEFRALTGSVTAAILLQQIFYRWMQKGSKPFFKFKSPCNNDAYRDGDSWTEELGFSIGEFDTALEKIATKVKKDGDRPNDVFVWYWVDNDRKTHYDLNSELFLSAIEKMYSEPFKKVGKSDIARGENGKFQSVKRENGFGLVKRENGFTKNGETVLPETGNPLEILYNTNITSETTTKTTPPNGGFDPESIKEYETQILEKQQAEKAAAELKAKEDAEKKKIAAKKKKETKWNGSFVMAKNLFDEYRNIWAKNNGKAVDGIYWNPKECGQLSNLLTAIKSKSEESGHQYESDLQFVQTDFPIFLEYAAKLQAYYMKEFTPTRFYSNFNTLYTDIKTLFTNGTNPIQSKKGNRISDEFKQQINDMLD